MCGLIGYSGKDPFDVDKIKVLMLWNGFERGVDSTGLYSPENGLSKSLLKSSKFLANPKENIIKPDTLFIGHVRATTVGGTSLKNAHPFKRGNYILAHNGTLKNHWNLLNKNDISFSDYMVDSDILCGIIAKNNSFNVLREIDGAAALLITDTDKSDVLYVYRNNERPLYKGYINGNMYISSIEDSLKYIGCINIKEFKETFMYTIKNGSIEGVPLKIEQAERPKTYNTSRKIALNIEYAYGYNANLRAVDTNIWTTPEGKSFKIHKNKFYRIIDIPNDKNVEFVHPDGNTYVVPKDTFYLEDIPKEKDYLVVLDNFDKSNTLYKEGEVVIATTVYTDDDIQIKKLLGINISNIIKQHHVRKATPDELKLIKEEENYIKSVGYSYMFDAININTLVTYDSDVNDIDTVVYPNTTNKDNKEVLKDIIKADGTEPDPFKNNNSNTFNLDGTIEADEDTPVDDDLDEEIIDNPEEFLQESFETIDDLFEQIINAKTLEEAKRLAKKGSSYTFVTFCKLEANNIIQLNNA